MKILQDWVSIRLDDPAFAIQRFQAFRNSSPSRPWISDSLTLPKGGLEEEVATPRRSKGNQASLAVFDTRMNSA